MREIRVESWGELNERMYEGAYNETIGRTRSPFVYRGLSDAHYRLTTSLVRLGGAFEKMEPHLLRNFRKYAPHRVVEQDAVWNWLAVAQHHGLPTRLLDWTFSPNVAMHFATSDLEEYGRDGAIWMVDFVRAHALLPAPLRAALAAEGSEVFTVEMLERSAPDLERFGALAEENFLLLFEPPSLDQRIVNQFALFSVMSDPRASFDDWARQHENLCTRLLIPRELKWEIRDRLDQANITERVLFPGLDGLSQWLRRYYSPRHP